MCVGTFFFQSLPPLPHCDGKQNLDNSYNHHNDYRDHQALFITFNAAVVVEFKSVIHLIVVSTEFFVVFVISLPPITCWFYAKLSVEYRANSTDESEDSADYVKHKGYDTRPLSIWKAAERK